MDELYREKGQKCYCLPNFIIFGVALLPWHVSMCEWIWFLDFGENESKLTLKYVVSKIVN